MTDTQRHRNIDHVPKKAFSLQSNPRIDFTLSSQRPRLPPLEGKPIIVNLIVNVEYWPYDRPMPRALMASPHGAPPKPPDVPNYSWVEYGLRCGMPRLFDMLARRGLRATASLNSRICDVYPTVAEAIGDAEWDVIGHGVSQESLKDSSDEAGTITESLDRLQAFFGRRPRGWLGPGIAQAENTPEHLKSLGVEFCHEWMVDDLPCWMRTTQGPLLALPYTLELNDSILWAIQTMPSNEMLTRAETSLKVFEREAELNPRVLTLALHPHLVAVPHRSYHLERTLDLLQSHSDVVFATSGAIADWYTLAEPAPASSA